MNTGILDCSHYASCKWEKKYRQKEKEVKFIKEQLEESKRVYNEELANHYKKVQFYDNIEKELENSLNKKKSKIGFLKETIIKKNEEIRELNDHIEFHKRKINRLQNFRHQSVDQINELEFEIEKSRKMLLTPVQPRLKKERKSMQSIQEFSISVIAETPETKQSDQEDLITSQGKLLQQERIKSKDLQNKLDMLSKEHQSLQSICEYMENKNASIRLRIESEKESQIKELTEKLELIRCENMELRGKLKELIINQSCHNTSEIFSENLKDEILKLDTSHLGSFEDCRTHLPTSFEQEEKQKLINMLEINLKELKRENEVLVEKIRVKGKHAKELNKVLKDNHLAFMRFKEQYSCAEVQSKVRELKGEKAKIVKDIEMKRLELAELNKKTIEKHVEIERISKKSIENSIRNSMAHLINRQKVFPEDYKRRRNIGSWGYGLLNLL